VKLKNPVTKFIGTAINKQIGSQKSDVGSQKTPNVENTEQNRTAGSSDIGLPASDFIRFSPDLL